MQGLKFLYDALDYDRVDYYIEEVFKSEIVEDNHNYANLLIDLSTEIHDLCMDKSRILLSKSDGYHKLSKALQQSIIRENAFLMQYKYDLSYLEDNISSDELEQLNDYAKELEIHITEILTSEISDSTAEAEFEKIKLHIQQHAEEIRSNLVHENQIKVPEPLQLGAGLGLGWLIGVDSVSGHVPILKGLDIADELQVVDREFIQKEDRFWNRHIHLAAKPRNQLSNFRMAVKNFSKKVRTIMFKDGKRPYVLAKKFSIQIEAFAPGLSQELSEHFLRRKINIKEAISHAKKKEDRQSLEIFSNDLERLEEDWKNIVNAVPDLQEFCSVVDLYLTNRYLLERKQYVDISKDLTKEPFIDQERNALLFEYQSEKQEIEELHSLKDKLHRIIGPNA